MGQGWGSYTPHAYIYTLTPTFDAKYQIYPLYKIQLNHSFTSSTHLFLKNLNPTLFWKTLATKTKHYWNPSLPKTTNTN